MIFKILVAIVVYLWSSGPVTSEEMTSKPPETGAVMATICAAEGRESINYSIHIGATASAVIMACSRRTEVRYFRTDGEAWETLSTWQRLLSVRVPLPSGAIYFSPARS